MTLRKPTLVQVFALVLVLVAAAALVLWLDWAFLDAWAPNIATGAIGLAATISGPIFTWGEQPKLDTVFPSGTSTTGEACGAPAALVPEVDAGRFDAL